MVTGQMINDIGRDFSQSSHFQLYHEFIIGFTVRNATYEHKTLIVYCD